MFCSTSKLLLRPASQAARFLGSSSRACAEAAQAAGPISSASESAPAPPPAPTTLPGASSLPDAFRAPPSSSSSSSPSPAAFSRPSAGSGRPSFAAASYKLNVLATRNNTILSLSHHTVPGVRTSQHHVVSWVSAGSAGFKGASRGTYDAAVEASLRMFGKIEEMINPTVGPGGVRKKEIAPAPTQIELVFKGFGQGRDAVIRTLMGSQWSRVSSIVARVTDATPIKVGGTRAKKRRVI